MERIVKQRILEDTDRLLSNIDMENANLLRLDKLIDTYLKIPRVLDLYKMAIDIKTSKCDMSQDVLGIRCAIPISKDENICISIEDEFDIYISLRDKDCTHLYDIKTIHPVDDDLQRELLLIVDDLKDDFGDKMDFQLLKEYLEEEVR